MTDINNFSLFLFFSFSLFLFFSFSLFLLFFFSFSLLFFFSFSFTLKQLTWPELARMIVLSQVLTDQGRGRDDIQHALRGSRLPNFRIAKNVARYIRYRLAVRMRVQGPACGNRVTSKEVEDDKLHQLLGIENSSDHCVQSHSAVKAKNIPGKLLSLPSIKNNDDVVVYSSESEIIAALAVTSSDPVYSETYQRCCKVLIKIANLNTSKNFFWEIDSVNYPDYYECIRKPIMIANVTASLVRQLYGNESMVVAESFYRDMRQVTLNCFAFNTEITAVHAQAQKIYQVCGVV